MGSTTHSIEVNAPLRAVYNQWTQFEEFPCFMEGVVEIRQQGPRALFWRVNVGEKDKQWEAEILEQVPDTRIVWESVDGTQNRGMIAFVAVDHERTRITLTMEYEPEGFLERAGDALGIPSSQVEGDLKRFRDFIEKRGTETGSWRGSIENGESVDPTNGISRSECPPEVKNGDDFSGSGFLNETGSRVGDGVSGFYRDAGVLEPSHEQIAERAYELYVAQGRTEGHALEDWLEAEKQLSEESRKL
jgi:Protein of unknown function (DUF2934)/Polyketide cyclase / dehydrase and lipid transport